MTINRRFLTALCVFVTPLVLVLALLIGVRETPTDASSHREAPAISKDAFADNTDTYVWIPQGVTDRIVLAASWIPFEGPEGGPNYWEWDDDVEYIIYIDNDGDAMAEISYTLSSEVEVGNGDTFLYNTGAIDSLDSANWNRKQYITVTEYFVPGTQPPNRVPTDHVGNIVTRTLTTPSNIGGKSIPDYAALEAAAIQTYTDPRNGDEINVYAGQTDDPFWVDLQVFDLLTLRGQGSPIGYADGPNNATDSLSGFNNHSLIIEVPISRLVQDGEPVLGVWATARRDGTQVSRLGMPLVNEVVLPLALKDAFNTLAPAQDLLLYTGQAPFNAQLAALTQESVENPELGTLLCALYDVPLPGDSDSDCNTEYMAGTPRTGRGDIFDIFLTGMVVINPFTITTAGGPVNVLDVSDPFTVTRPSGAVPAEMIRINTNISGALCDPEPKRLGVLAGDACGFPNGRRPMDDIVEIELLAVAGAAYNVLDAREPFTFTAGLIDVLDDGLDTNDVPFRDEFPYFAPAQSGRDHVHTNECQMGYMPPLECMATALSFGTIELGQNSAPWLQLMAALGSVSLVGGFEWLRRRRQR